MFKLQRIPLQVEILLVELQQFFNDYQWLHFKSIVLALLITPYKATVSGMVRVLGFGSHRSKHNEFLNDCSEILTKVLKFYAMLILHLLKKPGETIYLIIDDTSNKKRGKHIQAAFKFLEHTTKQYIWGQQLVCSIIEYRNLVIPYAIDLYVTKKQSRELNVAFRKKTDIALSMITDFESDSDQKVIVLADCYYASSPIIKYCCRESYSFISVLKSNRVFEVNNRKTTVREYSSRLFSKRNKKYKKIVRIKQKNYYTRSTKVLLKTGGVVKIVFSKQQSHKTALAVFTTNTTLPVNKILEAYSKRWSIEVFFKMSKQHLGLRAYQNVNLSAVESSVRLSLISYNLLTHVFIKEKRAQGNRLTDKRLAQFSVLDTRDHLRGIAMIDSIDYCLEQNINKSKNKVVKEIKNLLLAA